MFAFTCPNLARVATLVVAFAGGMTSSACDPAAAKEHDDAAPLGEPRSPRARTHIIVVVDGERVGTVNLVRTAVSLRDALPQLVPTQWESVRVLASGGRSYEIHHPSKRHHRARFELSKHSGGALVAFRNATGSSSKQPAVAAAARRPIALLNDVTKIEITTQQSVSQAARNKRPAEVVLDVGGKRVKLSTTEMKNISQVSVRNGKETGVSLAALVESQATLASVEAVLIEGLDGESLRIDRAALKESTQIHMIRINRNGALRYRGYLKAEGAKKEKRTGGVHDVQLIRILFR